jgi:hypothetical protein
MFDHVKSSQRLCSENKVLPQGTRTARRSCLEGPPTYSVELCPPEVGLHCACTKPRRSQRICLGVHSRARQQVEASIARLWRRVARTMVRPFCIRTTTRTTMQRTIIGPTGTTSKWFAMNPRLKSTLKCNKDH